MATSRQKKANRKNAKRGTGPRTAEGKARSSQNASKHGLFARDTVLPDEPPPEFLGLVAELEKELNAVGGFEHRLVRHIADAEWRMRRLGRLETGVLTHQLEAERLRVQRIQADLANLFPALEPKPGEQSQPQPEPGGHDQSTPAAATGQNAQPDSIYRQTTRELGSTIEANSDSPVLLSLSLYESRLNRKHQSLLKQLRLTQKIHHAEAAEHSETANRNTKAQNQGMKAKRCNRCPPKPIPPSRLPWRAIPLCFPNLIDPLRPNDIAR